MIKYGDQVFVRDPENFKLYWVDMVKVIKVIVNESEGKKPEQYVLKDLNINLQDLSVARRAGPCWPMWNAATARRLQTKSVW